jgi:hypothetical protein
MQFLASQPASMTALPPKTFLRFMVQRMLEIVESENFVGLFRVMLPEVVYNPDMPTVAADFIQRMLGFIASYLEAKMETGELRRTDASLAAQILAGSVIVFVMRRQIVRDPVALQYTQEQIADAVVETMFEGLKPEVQ